MRIRSLEIRRMPGFESAGFPLNDLAEGLNLVIGPNASGKTTTCRAIRGLLWPETLAGRSPVSLAGEWVDGEHTWRLEVEGTKATCQRDGVPAEWPALPGAHLANCFTITVDDLFVDTKTDAGLATEVSRQMAGGYDLGAIRQLEFMRPPRNHGKKERDEYRAAGDAVKAIQAEQEKLRGEEQELAGLTEQAARAGEAQARRVRVAEAIELLELRERIAGARQTLGQFPAGMDRLAGGEAATLAEIRRDLAAEEAALEAATAAAAGARARLEAAALPEGGIPDERIRRQKAHLKALEASEREIREIESRLAEAAARVAEALRGLGADADAAKLDRLDGAGLDEIEAYHRDVEAHKARRAAAEARLKALGTEAAPGRDMGTLIGGINFLQDWLDAGPAAAPAPRGIPTPLRLGALALAAAGVVLGLLVSPWWLLAMAPAVVVGAMGGWRGGPAGSDRRGVCQEQYGRPGLAPPASWDREAVLARLAELRQEQVAEQLRQRVAQERQSRQGDLEQLEAAGRDLAARREGLLAKTGLAGGGGDLSLVVMATNLRVWREARAAMEACRKQEQASRGRRDEQLGGVNAFLAEFGQGGCESYETAQMYSDTVFARAEAHRKAADQLERAEGEAAAAGKKVQTLRGRRARLFEQAGLADEDGAELSRRLGLLEEYRVASRAVRDLEAQERPLAAKLAGEPLLAAMTPEEAREQARQLEELTRQYAPLIERATEIRGRVEAAGRSTRLEEALAAVDRAAAGLMEAREEADLAAAGGLLLGQVEAQHKVQSQPHVFRRAAQWFNRFTRGRYELVIEEAHDAAAPAFRARDTAAGGAGLALDQLSRGTRMQLLLAVRLAFADEAQRGAGIPFVLDEVLSSTDPLRYQAVTECLLALVRDGRQVFYMTCQPGDAAAWRDIALQMGLTDARRLDLTDIRRLEGASGASLLDESAARVAPVPEPGDQSLADYAGLVGAPPLAPAAGADANHLAHFVDSPAQLHRLLLAGIETCGQIRSMAAHGPVDAYAPPDLLARILARAAVLDAFAAGWSVGRGKPLTREALVDARVSPSFIDRLSELARDLQWDPKGFMHALEERTDERTKGFRTAQIEPIRDYLVEHGHLDPADPLDKPALQTRVLTAANDPIRAGVLPAPEVRDLFERLWVLASH